MTPEERLQSEAELDRKNAAFFRRLAETQSNIASKKHLRKVAKQFETQAHNTELYLKGRAIIRGDAK